MPNFVDPLSVVNSDNVGQLLNGYTPNEDDDGAADSFPSSASTPTSDPSASPAPAQPSAARLQLVRPITAPPTPAVAPTQPSAPTPAPMPALGALTRSRGVEGPGARRFGSEPRSSANQTPTFIDPMATANPAQYLNASSAQATPAPAPSDDNDFTRGFKTGFQQVPELVGATEAFAGDVLKHIGADNVGQELMNYGLGVYKRNSKVVQQRSKDTDSFSYAIKHPSSLGHWLAYSLGYAGAQAVQSLATMAAGALAGSEAPGIGNVIGAGVGLVARKSVEHAVFKEASELLAKKVAEGVAEGTARRLARKQAAKVVEHQLSEKLGKDVAKDAVQSVVARNTGARVGAALGTGALNEAQEIGSVYGDARTQAQADGRQLSGADLTRIGLMATAAAGVDTLADLVNLSHLTNGAKLGAKATDSALKRRLKAGLREVAEGAAREGGTEGVQTVLERVGSGQSLTNAGAAQDIIDSVAQGVVGGAAAGAGAGLHAHENETDAGNQTPAEAAPADRGTDAYAQRWQAARDDLAEHQGTQNDPVNSVDRSEAALAVRAIADKHGISVDDLAADKAPTNDDETAPADDVAPADESAPTSETQQPAAAVSPEPNITSPAAPPVPHPDAEPGSLSDAANAIVENQTAPAPTPASSPSQDTSENTDVGIDGFHFADTSYQPPAPPWVDTTTGESTMPDDKQLTQFLASTLVDKFNTVGNMRINADALAKSWGLDSIPSKVRKQAQTLANNRLKQQRDAERQAPTADVIPAQDNGGREDETSLATTPEAENTSKTASVDVETTSPIDFTAIPDNTPPPPNGIPDTDTTAPIGAVSASDMSSGETTSTEAPTAEAPEPVVNQASTAASVDEPVHTPPEDGKTFPSFEEWQAKERASAEQSIATATEEHQHAKARIEYTIAALRGKMSKADRAALRQQLKADRATLAVTSPDTVLPADDPLRDITRTRYERAKAVFKRNNKASATSTVPTPVESTQPSIEAVGEKGIVVHGNVDELRQRLARAGFKKKGRVRKDGLRFDAADRSAIENALTPTMAPGGTEQPTQNVVEAPTPEAKLPSDHVSPEFKVIADGYYKDLPKEIGWETEGGHIIRAHDDGGLKPEVVGRTKWVAHFGPFGESPLWATRPEKGGRITPDQAREAFAKESRGDKLNAREQRFIEHAHNVASQYASLFIEHQREFERDREDMDAAAQAQAMQELVDDGASFDPADLDEALTLSQWTSLAADAGASAEQIIEATWPTSSADVVHNLVQLIANLEAVHGSDTKTTSVDRQGDTGAARQRAAAGGVTSTKGIAEPSARSTVQPDQVASKDDLFDGATARERVDAEGRRRDAVRNGHVGGKEDTGDGGLFDGKRPEQVDIDTAAAQATQYGPVHELQRGGASEPTASVGQPGVSRNVRAAAPLRNQLDLFITPQVRGSVARAKQASASLLQHVKNVEVGTFRSGIKHIHDWRDAAHIIAPLRKYPQEQMLAVVADAQRRPIAVLRHTIGLRAESAVDPGAVFGTIAQIPGAKHVWFAHNHPSGNMRQSDADRSLTRVLHGLMRGSGIETHGMIQVGPGHKTATHSNPDTGEQGLLPAGDITPAPRTGEVPIIERAIRKVAPKVRPKVTTPEDVSKLVHAVAHDQTGVLLLDNQNRLVGFLPMTDAEMEHLRTNDPATGAAHVMAVANEANASVGIPVVHDANAGRNINRLFAEASMKVLDIAVVDPAGDVASVSTTSGRLASTAFYSRAGVGASGRSLSVQDVQKIAAGILKVSADKLAVARVHVVESFATLPASIKKMLGRYGVKPGDIDAFHWRGHSYLLADQMHSPLAVQETIFHEMYTHGGLRALYGRELTPKLRRMLHDIGGLDGVLAMAKSQKVDLTEYLKNNDPPVVLMEELMAHMSKLTGTLRRVVQEFAGMVRDWLRRHGFAHLSEARVPDIAFTLRQARQAAREAASLPTGRPMFQRAFHGTHARDIDKNGGFKLAKIGTGEGNQAYGYGIYFADARNIAEHYRKTTTEPRRRRLSMSESMLENMFENRLVAGLSDGAARAQTIDWADRNKQITDKTAAREFVAELPIKNDEGQLYSANIPEDHELLDWDKPLSEQPPDVRAKMDAIGRELPDWAHEQLVERANADWNELTGKEAYNYLSRLASEGDLPRQDEITTDNGNPKQAASEFLNAHGIPGLRYLDGNSRGKGEGSHNYVIWDESRLNDDVHGLLDSSEPADTAGADRTHLADARKQWEEKGTDSPYFRKWFGDSKVVGAKGGPLVVYHGTPAEFTTFRRSDIGIHFGTEPQAKDRIAYHGDKGNIIPVFLSIQNPLRLEDAPSWLDPVHALDSGIGKYLPSSLLDRIKRLPEKYRAIPNLKSNEGQETARKIAEPITAEMRAALESRGYDGIVYLNTHERAPVADSYIAFHPGQVKLAVGNRGTFDVDNPDIRFSRDEPRFRAGVAPAGADAFTAKHLRMVNAVARDAMANWSPNQPRVRVLHSVKLLPESVRNDPRAAHARGVYMHGVVYLLAPNLRTRADIISTLTHEAIGHHGVEHIVIDELGQAAWDTITRSTQAVRAKVRQLNAINRAAGRHPDAGLSRVQKVVSDVIRRYGPDTDAATFAKETLAVMSEQGIHNVWTDRVVKAIRQWLRKIMPHLNLSGAELRQLLVAGDEYVHVSTRSEVATTKRAATTYRQRVAAMAATSFSVAPSIRSDAFKRWFGNWQAKTGSKVVGATGTPMIVYHGTGEDFWTFNGADLGASTGHASAPLGHFFTEDLADARHYARNAARGVPADERVVDAYLNIRKPKTMTLAQLQAIDSPAEAQALRDKLQAQGYDGIHVPEAHQWVAFAGNQVKSASNNNGAFDAANADIRFSLADHPTADEILDQPPVPVTHLSGNEIAGATPRDMRKNANEFIRRWLQDLAARGGAVLNTRTGQTVDVAARRVRHGFRERGAAHLQAVAAMESLIQRAAPIDVRDNEPATPDIAAVHTWVAPLDIAGQQFAVKLTVKQNVDGTYHLYAHKALEMASPDGTSRATPQHGALGVEPSSGDTVSIRQMLTAFKGEDAKYVPHASTTTQPAGGHHFSLPEASIKTINKPLQHAGDGAFARVKAWLAGKYQDVQPAVLGALQLRQLLELMEGHKSLKGASEYADLVQRMEADRNALLSGAHDAAEHPEDMLMQGAAPLTESWQKWARKPGWRGWLNGELSDEAKKLAKLMHDATISGLDPSGGYERLTMETNRGKFEAWTPEKVRARIKLLRGVMMTVSGDDKTMYIEEIKRLQGLRFREKRREAAWPNLVQRYAALSPEAQKIYANTRDWYAQHRNATEEALISRIEMMDLPETYRRSMVDRLRLQFEANRREGVYFPLNRDGEYWISLSDATGAEGFLMFEGAAAMAKAEKDLRARGFTIDGHGRRDDNARAKEAPPGTFVRGVIDELKKGHVSERVQDEVYQMFLRSLPEMSMRKRSIHRRAVPGYSQDALRAFAKNSFHGSYQLARLRYSQRMEMMVEAMQNNLDTYRRSDELGNSAQSGALDVVKADNLLAELKKRHQWIMSPRDSQLATKLTSIGFLYYLGMSPASALVNLTQGAQVTLPVLGGRHGFAKAGRVLAATTAAAMRTGGNMERTLTDPDEKQAYRLLVQRGDIDRTNAHTLAGVAEGDRLAMNPAWQRVMRGFSWMFHKAEIINREAAAMAAFRLARMDGKDFGEALKYASEIVNGTQFDYSNANRPRFMQQGWQKVLFQFKNYSQSMTWLMYRDLYQVFKGETPEVRKAALKTFTGIMGMTALMAGVVGLPIINLMAFAANAAHAAFGDDDEPWDFLTQFRKWLDEMFGEGAGSLIADGAVDKLGVHLSSRVSLSNLWFRDADKQLEGTDAYHQFLESVAGPLGGLTKNVFFVGPHYVSQGHVWRGVETMLPSFAKNGMKSLRYAAEGVNTLRGDPIIDDPSAAEDVLQFMGFQPQRVADQWRENDALMNAEQFVKNRRRALMNAFAMSLTEKDPDASNATMRKIEAFNLKWPQYPIDSSSLRRSLRARASYSQRAENGVKLNQRLEGRLREITGVRAS